MNRDMLKLRKDPTIPPSAATVTTSTTTAFPVSPRRQASAGESRAGGARIRTSSKGTRPNTPTNSTAASSASMISTSSNAATALSTPAGTVATAGIQPAGSGLTGLGNDTVSSGSQRSSGNVNNQFNTTANRASGESRPARTSTKKTDSFKFDTNGALWALSASPDFSMVAVVGRDVLKILSVTDSGAEETINLKTVGIRNNFAGSMDVKWGPTTGRDAKIATIGTNGPIVIWDIGTHNKIDRTIKEHTRSVNRICFSPQDPNLLLSASSDSTVRLWDLRARDKVGSVMEAKDIVREVQFSPVSMHDIVAGYESGNIQRWDLRNLSASEKKFMAHMGFVTSLDYHPNGRFLASGGRDRTIKVWDMEDEKRREIHTIPTIQYTSKVQWRPHKPYHLAASFKDESTVQVFDVRRPYVPLHVISQHDKDATSILWKDTDVLWSVSKDKTFTSTHIKGQILSSDLLPSGKAALNCYGQLAFTVSTKGGPDSFERDLVPRPGRSVAKSVALDGSQEATVYRTSQRGGVFDSELFNHEAFIYCAQNYSTEAGNVRDACEHNSNIAWQANRYRDSQTWTALKLFYSDMVESAIVVSQGEPDQRLLLSDKGYRHLFSLARALDGACISLFFNIVAHKFAVEPPVSDALTATKAKDEGAKDADEDSDASETRISRPAVPSLFAIKVSDAPVKRNWSHQETIHSLLEYYAEQGEVQMCVTMLLVLADEKDVPEFSRSQQWFASYIDLLSRFKLWSVATAISQACTDHSIHTMNQDSTTIHTSCSSCMKPILTRAPTSSGFWACDRCRKVLSSCSVCHKTVRGIFTWCTQCSHGFHLQHAQEWFSQSAECPTGCGHQCFPEMLKIQQEQEQLSQLQTSDDEAAHDSLHHHHPHHPHHHPRSVYSQQEQVSYSVHNPTRAEEVMESKGAFPQPYSAYSTT